MLTWSHKRRPRFHWKYCDLYDQMHSENRLSSSKKSNPDRVRPGFFYWMSQNLRVFDLKQGCRKIQLWILWYHNKASCFNLKVRNYSYAANSKRTVWVGLDVFLTVFTLIKNPITMYAKANLRSKIIAVVQIWIDGKKFHVHRYLVKLEVHKIKVHIFWEGHKILRNLHLTFDCMSKARWRFCKILRPSQNI